MKRINALLASFALGVSSTLGVGYVAWADTREALKLHALNDEELRKTAYRLRQVCSPPVIHKAPYVIGG